MYWERLHVKNIAATHCPEGHKLTPENTDSRNGWRICVACRKAKSAAALSRKRIEREIKRRGVSDAG
jgi:hypothetical protein